MWRLGPDKLFDRNHPSLHYVLDISQPAHEQVARKLIDIANQNPESPNIWNIRLQGQKRSITENRNMWGTFTSETFTPFLEFDFLGPDAHEMLNKSKSDWEAMHKGDKLDALNKLGKRMELRRIKDMYAYYNDGSGWQRPPWQSRELLMKALLYKAPWMASWDRLMRLLVRWEERGRNISADSYVEDIFDDYSNDDNEMSAESFEACCREWGWSRGEVFYHFRKLFEMVAQPSQTDASRTAHAAAMQAYESALQGERASLTGSGATAAGDPPQPQTVLDFQSFVTIFLLEPAPDLRFKEVPAVSSLVKALATERAAKLFKGKLAFKGKK